MNARNVLTLLLVATSLLLVACAEPRRVPVDGMTDIDTYSVRAFSEVYGVHQIDSLMDPFPSVQHIEGDMEAGVMTVTFRLRGDGTDYQVGYKNFAATQTASGSTGPFAVTSTCAASDCHRVLVLFNYQSDRFADPQIAGFTLQRSSRDSNRYEVVFSAPRGTLPYRD